MRVLVSRRPRPRRTRILQGMWGRFLQPRRRLLTRPRPHPMRSLLRSPWSIGTKIHQCRRLLPRTRCHIEGD